MRNAAINSARRELSQIRTFKVSRTTAAIGSAEFFVLFKPDGQIEDVKWIDGNTSMEDMRTELKKAKITFNLPKSLQSWFAVVLWYVHAPRQTVILYFSPSTTVKSAR